MTIGQSLQEFCTKNNLDKGGGENNNFFELKIKPFTFKLPNLEFRKKVIHIHDIQHVLYDCDISWKGESFIVSWEIATGFWKIFPIGILSLSAMGIGLLKSPKQLFSMIVNTRFF